MTWSGCSKIRPMNRFSVGRGRPSTAQSQSELRLKPSGFFQLKRRVWGAAQPLPQQNWKHVSVLPLTTTPHHHHHQPTTTTTTAILHPAHFLCLNSLLLPFSPVFWGFFVVVENMKFASKKRKLITGLKPHFCCHWQPPMESQSLWSAALRERRGKKRSARLKEIKECCRGDVRREEIC